ncbi:NADPH-dependent F420 reductase [Salsipaludibacter albus]|uniref:NADPH-dependent F420 reductase n=1 Tax=Salsipaludibacter albus TaxID=2849650 RepID=UPI001EE4A0B3|nr:NADPH-dependent F420 reductase [Salsipaludibacter albus]
MTSEDVREVLGIIGGTGPQGRGLAARWAMAGHTVHVGSRTRDKADAAVADVVERIGPGHDLHPGTNADVADAAEIVVVALPHTAQADTLPPLADAIGDKIVCNVVNPMVFDDLGPRAVPVPEGSAAEQCQDLVPDARVVSAFHDVSSRRLLRVDEAIDTHVLICGDDAEATHRVAHLASRIEGMWGVHCGPLRNSEYIENVTPVILWINRYYKIQAGLLIDGIERDPEALHAHRAEGDTRAGRKPRA